MNNLAFENAFFTLLTDMLERAQLPAALLDNDFCLVWSSTPALLRWPLLGTARGVRGVLAGFELADVRSEIAALGFFCTPGTTQNLFADSPALFYAAPAECGAYYIMQPPQTTKSASGLRPTGLELLVSSFESRYRAPLSHIFSAISVLGQSVKQNRLNSECRPYLEAIKQNSMQLLRNNQMISEYTYLVNGLYTPQPVQLDFYDFMRQLLSNAAELVESAGIAFSFYLPQGLLVSRCDPNLVTHVLFNLLSNACQFTRPDNQIAVRVRCVREQLLISVSDRGLGIPSEVSPHIFEPYYSYNHDGALFAGNGLGLSIAQQAASLLGGTLTLTSVAGKGTIAVFSLPAAQSHSAPLSAHSELPEYARDHFSALRVMLCDSLPPEL